MCGRFVMLTPEEVESVVAAVEGRARARLALGGGTDGEGARPQARPGSVVPYVGKGDGAGELEIAEAVWGFEVPWGKGPVFNTRVESALSGSPMWREAVAGGRCIVPAAAFFEPHTSEMAVSPRTGRKVKQSYEFADSDGGPLLLAGLQDGGRCSIVTCEPNRWVAPIHPRMPLVLRFEEVPAWLGDDWAELADRSTVELAVRPELPSAPQPSQLSLF